MYDLLDLEDILGFPLRFVSLKDSSKQLWIVIFSYNGFIISIVINRINVEKRPIRTIQEKK